jgi:hypothetical protein
MLGPAFKSHDPFGSSGDPKRCRFRDLEGVDEMNSYHERTQHLIQFKIPPKGWAVIALAMGVFFALLIIFASVDI